MLDLAFKLDLEHVVVGIVCLNHNHFFYVPLPLLFAHLSDHDPQHRYDDLLQTLTVSIELWYLFTLLPFLWLDLYFVMLCKQAQYTDSMLDNILRLELVASLLEGALGNVVGVNHIVDEAQ